MTKKSDLDDLDYLGWVAEGRAAMVPAEVSDRLVAAGLVVKASGGFAQSHPLELSPTGLDHIRSSDQ